MARRLAGVLFRPPARSMAIAAARVPAGSASFIWAVVGRDSTSMR